MIIFLNDDRAYLSWITRHRQGYVIDGRRKGNGRFSLHRATCPEIKSGSPRQHPTAGAKLKACSLDRQELVAWSAEENRAVRWCEACRPDDDRAVGNHQKRRFTKLASNVLEYVLEAALIHMEGDCPDYRLTELDIAHCLGRTPAQISHVLEDLIGDGFLTTSDKVTGTGRVLRQRIVLPTVAAIRTIPAFQSESDSEIRCQLGTLGPLNEEGPHDDCVAEMPYLSSNR